MWATRLADQPVDMFRHDHVADHHEPVTPPDFLQNAQEHIAPRPASQKRAAVITTGGDEV
jgi:hypothetical protein